jgi:hypothetical protein
VQREKEEEYIRIDATCINQDDVRERNHQVAVVGRIYATVQKAIVWLGCKIESQKLS